VADSRHLEKSKNGYIFAETVWLFVRHEIWHNDVGVYWSPNRIG